MRDLALTVFVFGLLPLAVARPYYGVLLWSWLGYMNPHRLTWSYAYNFPFVQLAAVATLIGVLFFRERKEFPWMPVTVVWVLFVIWTSFTTLFALNPDSALYEWERFLKIQLMVIATLLVMARRERIDWLVWVIVASIGFFGLKGGFFTIVTGGQFLVWGPPKSFIEGNNEIAFALLITIPLMRYLQLRSNSHWIKLGLFAIMALSGLAILASYSRGAFLAAAAMLFVLILKSRGKLIVVPTLMISAMLALSFMPEKWTDRIESIQTYQEDKSAMGRINAWMFAFNLAKDRPIMGGGFRTFTKELFYRYAPNPEDFHDAHSIYFEVLAEHGFIGLGLFLSMGLLVLLTGTWIIRRTKKDSDLNWAADLARMLQVSFVGYAVGGSFLGLAYFDLPYHLMAVMVLTRVVVQRELLTREAEPRHPARPAAANVPA